MSDVPASADPETGPESPAAAAGPGADPLPAPSGGAWTGALVVFYAAFVSILNGALLAVVLPARPLLEYTALDVERRSYDQGGVDSIVEVGAVVRTTWAAVEAPLLFTAVLGTLLTLAVLLFGFGVVLGRERGRVMARICLALRALHEVAAALWVGLAVLPDLPAHTEAVYGALRVAAEEAGQLSRIGEPPALLTGDALPWAAGVGAVLHLLVLVWLFRRLGTPRVREWCARRSAR